MIFGYVKRLKQLSGYIKSTSRKKNISSEIFGQATGNNSHYILFF